MGFKISGSIKPSGKLKVLAPIPDPTTKLLMHFDESPIIDSSTLAQPITNVTASATGAPKFGTNSGNYTSSNSYSEVASSPSLNLKDVDFTIEFFFKFSAASNGDVSNIICGRDVSGATAGGIAWFIGLHKANSTNYTLQYNISTDGNRPAFGSGLWWGNISANTWRHLAIVSVAGVPKMYLNGVGAGSTYNPITRASDTILIGDLQAAIPTWSGEFTNMQIDELRIRKEAVYTNNFTPPTAPFVE